MGMDDGGEDSAAEKSELPEVSAGDGVGGITDGSVPDVSDSSVSGINYKVQNSRILNLGIFSPPHCLD